MANMHAVVHTNFGDFMAPICWSPHKQPALAVIYFFSYTLIVSCVVMSLFIGAVCGGID
jgi:hypothetical protein